MKVEKLEKANIIQTRISDVTKAIKWLSSGGEISLMANKQIGTSIEVTGEMKNMLIVKFTEELENLNKEFEEL